MKNGLKKISVTKLYTYLPLLNTDVTLTSLDGVVISRYRKDFSAWLSAGRDSSPHTLFSSLFELYIKKWH